MPPKIAIIGSCVTRDMWPLAENVPGALLYVSRTSLPSLVARAPAGLSAQAETPPMLKRHQHNALRADLGKTALEALLSFRPTHIIFDFIDERFDLLRAGPTTITRSWELMVSGYLDAWPTNHWDRIPRLSAGCFRIWRDALDALASVLLNTPLASARIILHSSRWANTFQDETGDTKSFPSRIEILPGEAATIADHNALLESYEAYFLEAFSNADVISSNHRKANTDHRWGLSPFHYLDSYYNDIHNQLNTILATEH